MSEAFSRRNGRLHAEAVPVEQIVEAVGTPAFIYSASELAARYDALDAAFSPVPHSICYAIEIGRMCTIVIITAISDMMPTGTG